MEKLKGEWHDLLKESRVWWEIRAFLIANDKYKEVGPISLGYRLHLRRN